MHQPFFGCQCPLHKHQTVRPRYHSKVTKQHVDGSNAHRIFRYATHTHRSTSLSFISGHEKQILTIHCTFYNNGYRAIFSSTSLIMEHTTDPAQSFKGQRDHSNNMWSINLDNIPSNPCSNANISSTTWRANNVYNFTMKRDIVRYLHCAASSPVPSTWYVVIENGHYTTWPGLSSQQVRKHLPKSLSTTKGHMRQIHQNIRLT